MTYPKKIQIEMKTKPTDTQPARGELKSLDY